MKPTREQVDTLVTESRTGTSSLPPHEEAVIVALADGRDELLALLLDIYCEEWLAGTAIGDATTRLLAKYDVKP